MQYHIYQAVGPEQFTETENQTRVYAGFVETSSLESAYLLSQNHAEPWNSYNPCRSTSIGDVIQDDKGFYMVCNLGFRLLNSVAEESEMTEADYWSGEPYLEQ